MKTLLPERLRLARERVRLTQTDVAERLELTPQSVSQWEAGRMLPSSNNLRKLAGILGVSLDWLGSDESRLEDLDEGSASLPVSALRSSTSSRRAGYVRVSRLAVEASAGAGVQNDDFPEVLDSLDIAEWRIRALFGRVPPSARRLNAAGL